MGTQRSDHRPDGCFLLGALGCL